MPRLLRRIGLRVAVLLAAVVAATLGPLVGGPAASAALAPNTSIFFWMPGLGVTGTVHNGIFSQNALITTNMAGWTEGAVTRDTLLLYNKANGNAAIATYTGGVLSPAVPKTITGLGKGYALAAGSCDTVLLYNPGSGKTLLLLVHGGKITHRKTVTIQKHAYVADASCNTVTLWFSGSPAGGRIGGVLKGGSFTKKETQLGPPSGVAETHSTDSLLYLDQKIAQQAWGTSGGGHDKVLTVAEPQFTNVSMLAGTADSALLYDPATGFADFGTLSGGVFQSVITPTLSSGWKIIVGGR
jgi:hypothetical protein